MSVKITLEWHDRESGKSHARDVKWGAVPRSGEFVEIDEASGEGGYVCAVLWREDGSVAVRIRP